jgi:hypothetical protein
MAVALLLVASPKIIYFHPTQTFINQPYSPENVI